MAGQIIETDEQYEAVTARLAELVRKGRRRTGDEGKRPISAEHARKLARMFPVQPGVFIYLGPPNRPVLVSSGSN